MIDWSLLLIPLVIIIDILAISDLIKRRQYAQKIKILWIIVIILFPIIGVSLYYLQISLSYKNGQQRH
jgi:hypothetical protein